MTKVAPVTGADTRPDANEFGYAESRDRTPWLLVFLCILIPTLPTIVVIPGPLKSNGSPARIIAIALLGLAILGFVLTRRTLARQTIQPGMILILLYLLSILTIYGVGLTHNSDAIIEASKTRAMIFALASAGLAVYILTRVHTPGQRQIVLASLAIGLTFACAVGVLQQWNIDVRYLLQPPGFVLNTEDLVLSDRLGAKRVVGTSQHAIEFSLLAAMAVPLNIHFARHATKRYMRHLASLAIGLALLAIPAAVSRTGILAIAAALIFYMWNFRVRELAVAILGGLVAIFAYIALFPAVANALWSTIVNSEGDESVLSRQADYATVSETFRAHPIFGLGLGASPPSEYGFLDNQWLQVLVQGGIIGLAGLFLLAIGGIFGISARLRRATTRCEKDEAYAIGSMLIAILVSSFTFDLFAYQQSTFIFFILFGLLWSDFRIPADNSPYLANGAL
jgi:O-antigen ligase